MRRLLLLFLLAACGEEPFVETPFVETVEEYAGYLPDTGSEWTSVFLVRDERTGKPVEGALVRQCEEWSLTDDGEWAYEVARKKTDRFGLVYFENAENPGASHWALSKEGYAPTEEYGIWVQEEVALERGRERVGRLLGIDGKPLAGVELEYKVGCAHAPSFQRVKTDADGVFRFRDVGDGDITFEDPRCEADYWSGPTPPPPWPVATYQTLPGGTLRGRVLEADGTPPKWAVVESNTSSRGPRVRVDEQGYFELKGVNLAANLFIHRRGSTDTVVTRNYRPGGPLVIRLDTEEPDVPEDRVRVVVALRGNGEEEVDVYLDRESDGRRFVSPMAMAETEIWVVPGAYVLSAGDGTDRFYAAPRHVQIDGPKRLVLEVEEQPRLVFDPPDIPGEFMFALRVRGRSWEVEPDQVVYVPAQGDAWISIQVNRQPRMFPIGQIRDGRRRVEVRLPRAKRLRLVGLEGDWEAYLLWDRDAYLTSERDDPVLETSGVGEQTLVVEHRALGIATKKIDLPWEAPEPIVIEGFQFEKPEARELRVLDGAGNPLQEAPVETWGDESPPHYERFDTDTDADGRAWSALFVDGAWVTVAHEDYLQTWARLKGDGPYEVRLGSVTIEVELPEGIEEMTAVIGGNNSSVYDEGKLVLRGVAAGRTTLLLGAPGHFTKVYELELKAGETRTIRPTLRRR